MAKLSIVGVDDEYPALELIEHYCSQIADVELVALFQHPKDALDYLTKNPVDLVILDINMPFINGIDLLLSLPYKPLCIFLTMETQYAVKAFELDVIHYLVKPVDFSGFNKAISKAKDFLQFRDSMEKKKKEEYIMFKSDYIMNKILLADVRWVQGCSEYIVLVTPFKKYMILDRMSNFEEKYRDLGFIRIHKSYIVLGAHITSYDMAYVHLKDGEKLPLGRTYKNQLKSLF